MKMILILLLCGIGMALVAPAGHAADVKELWKKNCGSCHGPDGKGNTKAGKKAGVVDLTNPAVQAQYSDEEMFRAVKEGKKDKNKVKMKPAEGLTDAEIKTLIVQVRRFKS